MKSRRIIFVLSVMLLPAIEILPVNAQKDIPVPGMHAYTKNHAQHAQSPDLLGGALTVNVEQTEGITYFVLPGPRELDPSVFGTPDQPVGFDPAPFPLLGVPLEKRMTHEGEYTITQEATPFSDWAESGRGSLSMKLVDQTAIDAQTTKDQIDFECTFADPSGQQFRVVCEKPLPHGIAYPFFGGVLTNHLLHGVSGVGTRLMPTEFTYAAFWGVGEVHRDGEKIADGQLIHVMITEFVRGQGYQLLFDRGVGEPPSGKTIHLLVAPFKPTTQGLQEAPLKSGFNPIPFVEKHLSQAMQSAQDSEDESEMAKMQQVKQVMDEAKQHMQEAMEAGKLQGQPFFHVMFNDFEMEATRGEKTEEEEG